MAKASSIAAPAVAAAGAAAAAAATRAATHAANCMALHRGMFGSCPRPAADMAQVASLPVRLRACPQRQGCTAACAEHGPRFAPPPDNGAVGTVPAQYVRLHVYTRPVIISALITVVMVAPAGSMWSILRMEPCTKCMGAGQHARNTVHAAAAGFSCRLTLREQRCPQN